MYKRCHTGNSALDAGDSEATDEGDIGTSWDLGSCCQRNALSSGGWRAFRLSRAMAAVVSWEPAFLNIARLEVVAG